MCSGLWMLLFWNLLPESDEKLVLFSLRMSAVKGPTTGRFAKGRLSSVSLGFGEDKVGGYTEIREPKEEIQRKMSFLHVVDDYTSVKGKDELEGD